VIERKLANLAQVDWPRAPRPHRIVVVDDGSGDDTAARARALAPRLEAGAVRLEVRANDVRPGKSGAMEAGLRALRGTVDLVVLTDADVVLEPQALVALARAFAADPGLGMACAAQRFVRDLAADGSARGADGGEPRAAPGWYDRVTAGVRRLESRAGRLFSVHGQLLAWRAALGLTPTPGHAADDLDLMLQARLAGGDLRLVREARFLEVKTPAGARGDAQALRRARAYVQFLRHPRLDELAARGPRGERLQVWAYRHLPTAAPWLVPAVLGAGVLLAALLLPRPVALGVLLVALGVALGGPGRRLLALLAVIRAADRCEAGATLSDRWETPRA
jgi:glycosyltransferase involved in cell wall biosynthesis